MLTFAHPRLFICWGDQETAFEKEQFYTYSSQELLAAPQFAALQGQIDTLVVLKQVHGTRGHVLTDPNHPALFAPYRKEGDFLITTLPRVGLGIITADCLPVTIYDPVAHALGVAHAGWAGTLQEVSIELLEKMQEVVGTRPEFCLVFFGPSARGCCYTLDSARAALCRRSATTREAVQEREGRVFFDLPLGNKLQLERKGVKKEAFDLSMSLCTLCTFRFCSHRRQGVRALRQATISFLRQETLG